MTTGRSRRLSSGPPLVVLGGTYNALSAARAVASRGVPAHVLSDGRATPQVLSASRFVHGFFLPEGTGEITVQWLQWLSEGPRDAVVLPAGDEGLELVANHRADLVAMGYRPVEANDDVVRAMLDKERAAKVADAIGIPTPRTVEVNSAEVARDAAADLGFPCAIKPRHSHQYAKARSGHSPPKGAVVNDEVELAQAYGGLAASGADLTLTEFVVGPEENYCSYYTFLNEDGEPLVHFTKRKLRQFPAGFGLGTYHETAWLPDVAELGLALFRGLGVRGLANVEFKRDARDGRLKLIEANLRLTAADDLVRRAGVEFAWLAYSRATGRTGQPVQPVPASSGFVTGLQQWLPSRDLRALLQTRSTPRALQEWCATLARRPHTPYFRVDDPGPSLAHAWNKARRRLSGAIGALSRRGDGVSRSSRTIRSSEGAGE